MDAMESTLVIIPTYNEKENVETISTAVLDSNEGVDILFVDDNSPDGTGEILERIADQCSRIQVIHRADKQGLGRAYICGFKWALERNYEHILEMDADFSHRPEDVSGLVASAADADLVLGSRYVGGIRIINWPLNRLILSKSASLYVRLITGMPFTDPTGGFKCFRRGVLQSIDLDSIRSNGYSFQIEMTHQAWLLGFSVKETPIVFEERRSGQSKMNAAIVREAFWMVWKILFRSRFRRRADSTHPRSISARNLPG